MVGDLGASSDWSAIAARLGNGRTAGGVEARWQILRADEPMRTKPRWTADEDQRLTELVRAAPERASGSARSGPGMWDRIALSFPDRTASAVKSHWEAMNGQRPRKKARTDEPPPPEEAADDPSLDPFGLRAGLSALFSPWGWGS